MSAVVSRLVTIVRHEHAVRSPATWGDISAAYRAACAEMPECRPYAVTVEARDDEIVIWWTGEIDS